jgi:serine/threonine protein kinase
LFGFDERSIWFFVIIGAIVGGGLLVILLLMIILLAACCIWRRKRSSKKKKDSQKSSGSKWEGPHRAEFISPMTPPSLWTTLHWGNAQGLPDFLHQTVMDYGMNRNMVAIHNTLKTGTYTCILRGRLLADRINQENPANIQLRIKMLAGFTEEGANRKEEVTQFIEQATLTKGLNHNNILRLVGLCAEDGYVPLVLYPYCEHGNMQSFLEKCRLSRMTDGRQMVTTQHQLTFCLQIAEGMLFLYQNGIVHPDLALRNCYMDANFTVKISDGALTSDLYPDLYHKVYGVKRPVRWSALETLTQGICGSKSNVWSFGITCVETFTLGELPYASVRNRNILAHVLMGNRPVRPNNCPSEV